jgi:hypothetical protein
MLDLVGTNIESSGRSARHGGFMVLTEDVVTEKRKSRLQLTGRWIGRMTRDQMSFLALFESSDESTQLVPKDNVNHQAVGEVNQILYG